MNTKILLKRFRFHLNWYLAMEDYQRNGPIGLWIAKNLKLYAEVIHRIPELKIEEEPI